MISINIFTTSQGTLISRQRIRLPYSYDLYFDVLDLNIGRDVTFFGKVFKVRYSFICSTYVTYDSSIFAIGSNA